MAPFNSCVETYFLVLSGVDGRTAVLPRRLTLTLSPGSGRLRLPSMPPTDENWRSSVAHAWAFALDVTESRNVDGEVGLAGGTPLLGGSAGLSFGLLALALLTETALPPHFATGWVTDGSGCLAGGTAANVKARAASELSTQLGPGPWTFLSPPIDPIPSIPGLSMVIAADVGDAFARLHPSAYSSIAARHARLRSADQFAELGQIDRGRPFALITDWPHAAGPATTERLQVIMRRTRDPGAPQAIVGERNMILWKTSLDATLPLGPQLRAAFGLGRRATNL